MRRNHSQDTPGVWGREGDLKDAPGVWGGKDGPL